MEIRGLKRKRIENIEELPESKRRRIEESQAAYQALLHRFDGMERKDFLMVIESALKTLEDARNRLKDRLVLQNVLSLYQYQTFQICVYNTAIERIKSIYIDKFEYNKFDEVQQGLRE